MCTVLSWQDAIKQFSLLPDLLCSVNEAVKGSATAVQPVVSLCYCECGVTNSVRVPFGSNQTKYMYMYYKGTESLRIERKRLLGPLIPMAYV